MLITSPAFHELCTIPKDFVPCKTHAELVCAFLHLMAAMRKLTREQKRVLCQPFSTSMKIDLASVYEYIKFEHAVRRETVTASQWLALSATKAYHVQGAKVFKTPITSYDEDCLMIIKQLTPQDRTRLTQDLRAMLVAFAPTFEAYCEADIKRRMVQTMERISTSREKWAQVQQEVRDNERTKIKIYSMHDHHNKIFDREPKYTLGQLCLLTGWSPRKLSMTLTHGNGECTLDLCRPDPVTGENDPRAKITIIRHNEARARYEAELKESQAKQATTPAPKRRAY